MTQFQQKLLKDLREHYRHTKDGRIFRKKPSTRNAYMNHEIKGNIDKGGYVHFSFNIKTRKRTVLKKHRVLFALEHGWFPEEVDHINRIRSDNRIKNLRASTRKLNAQNLSEYKLYKYAK